MFADFHKLKPGPGFNRVWLPSGTPATPTPQVQRKQGGTVPPLIKKKNFAFQDLDEIYKNI